MSPNLNSNHFSNTLIRWYKKHGRFNLPWQQQKTAYRVWISEIMLQQTQVNTVIPYYQRFIKRFSSLRTLALAEEDEVLFYWSGLGYYTRARNLHKTAKIIHTEYQGRFPKTQTLLESLPGIGKSTAGAILSFAYQLPTTICDGNVKRVLARIFAINQPKNSAEGEIHFWQVATALTPKKQTDLYNQAIMDLGATVCTRTKPVCTRCPFETTCQAHALSQETAFPVSLPKKINPTKTIQLLIYQSKLGYIMLEKRPSRGIWGGLWSFPECALDTPISSWSQEQFAFTVLKQQSLPTWTHKFTHFNLEIHPLLIHIAQKKQLPAGLYHWHQLGEPLPGGVCQPVTRLLEALK